MSSMLSTKPSHPSLVAILLVTKTRAGPNIVFHYPLNPRTGSSSSRLDPAWYGNPSTQSHDFDDTDPDHSDDTDDDDLNRIADGGDVASRAESLVSGQRPRPDAGKAGSVRGTSTSWTSRNKGSVGIGKDDVDEELVDETKLKRGRNETTSNIETSSRNSDTRQLFGFSLDGLSKILAPSHGFNKRRYEVSLDDLVFVGIPRFAREGGTWRKKKKTSRRTRGANPEPELELSDTDEGVGMAGSEQRDVLLGTTPSSDAGSESKSNISGESECDLAMFNLVFVLNPTILDYQMRVDDMYDHVLKKFSKALKYEQAHNNYVQKQSRLISTIKDQAKERQIPFTLLWPKLIRESSLALAIANAFEAVSNSKIADIALSEAGSSILRLPQADSTDRLPTPFQPQMPGLWLTTANVYGDEGGDASFNPHFALLLLVDRVVLIQEVESDKTEHSTLLADFVRHLTPHKSLFRLAQRSPLSLRDMVTMARHLIYWRRARAVPPIRPGDTYIVSPNADTRQLVAAAEIFAARFPAPGPSLLDILGELSGKPRPYKYIIPVQDYKTKYMSILAWLMQGGWVTQLRTFGWIQVSAHVKASVARMENQQDERTYGPRLSISSSSAAPSESILSPTARSTSSAIHSPQSRMKSPNSGRSDARPSRAQNWLKSPIPTVEPDARYHGLSVLPSRSRTSTPGSDRTQRCVGDDHRGDKKPSPLRLTRSPSPLTISRSARAASPTAETAPFEPLDVTAYTASLIHSPERASSQETKWIEFIGNNIQDEEIKKLWPLLLQYLGGHYALEAISARENRKKKVIERALAKLREEGCIYTVKHW